MTDTTGEFVKVPFYIEADGQKTFFLPDCRRPNVGYEIGQRGKPDKEQLENYWDALEKLNMQPQPRFRRKNKIGNAGTVTCQPGNHEQVSRDFIEQERLKFGG